MLNIEMEWRQCHEPILLMKHWIPHVSDQTKGTR